MKTAKAATKRVVDIHDAVDLVDKIVTSTDAVNLAQNIIAETREVLDEQVAAIRRSTSYGGVLSNTVHVRGTNRSVTYQFSNSYTRTSLSAEDKMREDLGPHYDALFTREQVVKLRDGAAERLKKLLGERYEEFFETTEMVVPQPEFRQKVHALRQEVGVEVGVKLDHYEIAFTTRAAMKVNG